MTKVFIKGDRITGKTPLGRTVTGIVKIVDGAGLWIDVEGGDPLAWAPVHRNDAVHELQEADEATMRRCAEAEAAVSHAF